MLFVKISVFCHYKYNISVTLEKILKRLHCGNSCEHKKLQLHTENTLALLKYKINRCMMNAQKQNHFSGQSEYL